MCKCFTRKLWHWQPPESYDTQRFAAAHGHLLNLSQLSFSLSLEAGTLSGHVPVKAGHSGTLRDSVPHSKNRVVAQSNATSSRDYCPL